MIIAVEQVNGIFAERFLGKRAGSGLEFSTVHQDFAFGSDEQDPTAVPVEHLDAVSVEIAQTFRGLGIFRRNDLDWPAVIHAEAPLGNVKVVSPPIGHHSTRVFAVIAPIRKMLMHPARA